MADTGKRQHWVWLVLGGFLLLVAVVGYLAQRGPTREAQQPGATAPGGAGGTRSYPVPESAAAASQPGQPRLVAEHKGGWKVYQTAGKTPTPEERQVAVERARRALEDYQKSSVHPPWSLPAGDATRNVWEWNVPMSVGQPFALDKDQQPISGELTLDRLYAGPGETITATLTVWRGEYQAARTEAVPFTAVGLISTGGLEPKTVPGLAFAPVPGTPTQKVLKFVPSAQPILRERTVTPSLLVTVTAGDREFIFSRQFRYASEPALVITGKASEGMVNGSLEVRLRGVVKKPTAHRVRVRATLFDAAGQTPIAVYDHLVQVSGAGEVPLVLTFFGKVIRERGINGPYSIRALNGKVQTRDDQGGEEIVWSHDGVFATKRYAATDFSDAEWDAPEKQEKINSYHKVIKDLEGR
jgi:hypothetical protein